MPLISILLGVRSPVLSLRDPNPATVIALCVRSRCFTAVHQETPGGRLAHKSFRKPYKKKKKNVGLPTRDSHLETKIQLAPGDRPNLLGERLRVTRVPSSPALPLGVLQRLHTPPHPARQLPPPSLLRLPQIAPSRFPRLPSCFPVATQTRPPSRRGDSCGPGAPWVARAWEAQCPGLCRPRRGAA